MDLQEIIEQLTAERGRIERAIAALGGTNRGNDRQRGRPPKNAPQLAIVAERRHRKTMSSAAKKKIGAAMKKRWAERKKAQAASANK